MLLFPILAATVSLQPARSHALSHIALSAHLFCSDPDNGVMLKHAQQQLLGIPRQVQEALALYTYMSQARARCFTKSSGLKFQDSSLIAHPKCLPHAMGQELLKPIVEPAVRWSMSL